MPPLTFFYCQTAVRLATKRCGSFVDIVTSLRVAGRSEQRWRRNEGREMWTACCFTRRRKNRSPETIIFLLRISTPTKLKYTWTWIKVWKRKNRSSETIIFPLTLILLVAKTWKWLKPWHMGTYLRVLNESYPMNTNVTGLRWLSKIFAS